VAVTAVSLFGPEVRAKAIAGVLGGGSLAVVLGVPAGTWLGQQWGWRLPFLVLSALGVSILAAIALLLPSYHPAETHAAAGARPDRRRYRLLIVTTVLIVTGSFSAYTYISTFLTHVAGLPAHRVAAVLLVSGIASACGVAGSGALFDKYPAVAAVLPQAFLASGLLGLYVFGTAQASAFVLEALASLGLGTFVVTSQNRVMIFAPGNTDVASAWVSAAFNVGIASGSLVGSVVVPLLGVRATTLVGGALALAALAVVLGDEVAAGQGRTAAAARGAGAAVPAKPGAQL
jgi:predicted MFS family arabinose efflux permease